MARDPAPNFAEQVSDTGYREAPRQGVVDSSDAVSVQRQTNLIGQVGELGMAAYKGYEVARVERETENLIEEYRNRRNTLDVDPNVRQSIQPVLEEHLGDISKLHLSYKQGAMSKNEFSTRLTAITKDATNRAPGFFSDIVDQTRKVMELSGINQTINDDAEIAKSRQQQFRDYSKNVMAMADELNMPVDYSRASDPIYLQELNERGNEILQQRQLADQLKMAAEGRQELREEEVQSFIDSGALGKAINGTLTGFTQSALDLSNEVSSNADYTSWLTNVRLKGQQLVNTFAQMSSRYADNANVKENMKYLKEGIESTIETLEKFKSKEDAAKYLSNAVKIMQDKDTVNFRKMTGFSKESFDALIKLSASPNLSYLVGKGNLGKLASVTDALIKAVPGIASEPNALTIHKESIKDGDSAGTQMINNNVPKLVLDEGKKLKAPERFTLYESMVDNLIDPVAEDGTSKMSVEAKENAHRVIDEYLNTVVEATKKRLEGEAAEINYLENGRYMIVGDVSNINQVQYTRRLNNGVVALSRVLDLSPKDVARVIVNPKMFPEDYEGFHDAPPPENKEFGVTDATLGYKNLATEKGEQYGVEPTLLLAQIDAESRGNPNAKSKAGAQGLAQFMPATAKQYKVDVTSAESSIDGQARYMRDLLNRFKGNTEMALAAYNYGPGNVNKLIYKYEEDWKEHLPKETKTYLERILGKIGYLGE